MKRDSAFLPVVILGFILAFAGTVWANGEEFFAAPQGGNVDLVYFGRIKDKQTRRSVTDQAVFLLRDKATGLSFTYTNDKPGHYRSPDIGKAIKDIGEQVDANAFEVEVWVAGYKKATVTRVPRKTNGNVELDFLLEPVSQDIEGVAGVSGTGGGAPFTTTAIVLIGSMALFFIVRAARTSGRPRTTTR